jgi:hypothetical protein
MSTIDEKKLRIELSKLGNVVCVDPGRSTGVAYFINGEMPKTATIKYKDPINHATLVDYCAKMCGDLVCLSSILCGDWKPDRAFIEFPGFWAGSAKSHASATSDAIPFLCGLATAYGMTLEGIGIKTTFVPVKWKGQMSKQATMALIKRKTGWEFKTDHETDAVGIGLAQTKLWPGL